MDVNKIKNDMASLISRSVFITANAFSNFVVRNPYFVFSLFITLIYYLPALKDGSVNAGFLYTGDVLGWYLPALAKTHSLLHSFNFTAIDYSTFNGSSDFFLSPNFFAYHPLVVIYCFFVNEVNVQRLGQLLVLLSAAHSFVACYFSTKLFTRFFSFDLGAAFLIASVFAFSMHMVNALGQPPFFFCVTIIPWTTFAALSYAEKPTARGLTLGCLPVIISFTAGYLPLGVASLALSVVLICFRIFSLGISNETLEQRLRKWLITLAPFVIGSIVVSPYLYSVYTFHHETSSAGFVTLFYAAHQLGQLPQTLLNVISNHFSGPGRVMEFPLIGGPIVIAVTSIFFLAPRVIDQLTSHEIKIFKSSSIIYVATVLAIFGNYSVVSDLVYYLVPQVGGMHLYERFLLPAHLIFAVIFAVMLNAVIRARPILVTRSFLIIFVLATLIAAFFVAYAPIRSAEIGLNNYVVFELLLTSVFLCALLVPGKNFIFGAAIILISLSSLDRMYDKSTRENTLESQRKIKPIVLDDELKARIVSYFKHHSSKSIIKYVDITPMWSGKHVSFDSAVGEFETFPKVFPDYVLKEMRLSSYGGFTFYLSARADYMRKMPVAGEEVAVNPDWEYLKNTGADFFVARESDLSDGPFAALYKKVKTEDVLRLPNDVVIVPIAASEESARLAHGEVFDNGYFKIYPTHSHAKADELVNIALGKPARQSSSAGADAKLAFDGNTDGDFSHGSASHTQRGGNSWLEVDLGAVEQIDNVTIWNRTDCCGYCLRNFWLFISDKPFKDHDTASDLSVRADTWGQQNFLPNPKGTIATKGVRGRYVRIQLPGVEKTLQECFLSIAEMQVFRASPSKEATAAISSSVASDLKVNKFITNNANYMRLDLQASVPTTIQYMFWKNPRLKYYLNGKRVTLSEANGINSLNVPAGHNVLEVRYRHWPLVIFWIFYTAYALIFLWILMPSKFRNEIWRRLRRVKLRRI